MKTFVRGLEKAGISFSLLNGGLKLSAPTGVVTHDIMAEIKKNKLEIIEFISNPAGIPKLHLVNGNTHLKPTLDPAREKKCKPSPVALEWLLKNRQALDDAGWTRAELYRRNKSKQGIAWLKLWEEAFSLAYLHIDGTIEIECSRHGRDYFQTARPASMLTVPVTEKKETI
jgi:hypothetical protein